MTIISVCKSDAGSTGSHSQQNKDSFTSNYRVTTNDALDGADTVIKHFETDETLPYMFDFYTFGNDSNPNAQCENITATPVDGSRFHWTVAVQFGPEEQDETQDENTIDDDGNEVKSTNPVEWRAIPSVSHISYQVPARIVKYRSPNKTPKITFTNTNYAPAQNAAGDIFIPGPEKTENIIVFKVSQYEEHFLDWQVLSSIIGKVNSTAFKIKYPYAKIDWTVFVNQAKWTRFEGAFERRNGCDVWRWDIELEIKATGYHQNLANVGTRYYVGIGDVDANGETYNDQNEPNPYPPSHLDPILDSMGDQVSGPVLLDADGKELVRSSAALGVFGQTRLDAITILSEDEADFGVFSAKHGVLNSTRP